MRLETNSVRFVVLFLHYFLVAGQKCELNLTIYRHAPCSRNLGPLRPLITLPSSSDTWLQKDAGCGCFKISGGKVRVAEPGLGGKPMQIHLDMRIGGSSVPQDCSNSTANGCGGFGSCVYCDVCQNLEGVSRKNRNDIVSLYKRGRKIPCGEKLQPKEHTDIGLKICLPPKNKLLEMLSPNPQDAQDIWKTFFRRNQAGRQPGVPFVIFARTFAEPINRLSKQELKERLYGSQKKGMVGCHWMYGLITDTAENDSPRPSPRRGQGPRPRVSQARGAPWNSSNRNQGFLRG